MSRRPSLPGAAELFRATGAGPAPGEHPPAREPERNGQRLRAADADAHAVAPAAALAASVAQVASVAERTASVTPLPPSPPPPAPEPVALASAPAPRQVEREPRPAPAEPIGRSTFDDDPAGRGRTNGVRQTRRQRMRTVGDRRPSGRERHEEKITVYCSAEELLDLESARLTLRGEHGLVVDRGRIVREAIAIILADLDAKGEDSILVRRFRDG
jgi:hypothetical protein